MSLNLHRNHPFPALGHWTAGGLFCSFEFRPLVMLAASAPRLECQGFMIATFRNGEVAIYDGTGRRRCTMGVPIADSMR